MARMLFCHLYHVKALKRTQSKCPQRGKLRSVCLLFMVFQLNLEGRDTDTEPFNAVFPTKEELEGAQRVHISAKYTIML